MSEGYYRTMIEKSALILVRREWPNSGLLLVREHGRKYWLFPGGKPEADENVEAALAREIREELSAELIEFQSLGSVEGHTPEGVALLMHLFSGSIDVVPRPSSEVAELRWLRREDLPTVSSALTPITTGQVFPFLEENKIW